PAAALGPECRLNPVVRDQEGPEQVLGVWVGGLRQFFFERSDIRIEGIGSRHGVLLLRLGDRDGDDWACLFFGLFFLLLAWRLGGHPAGGGENQCKKAKAEPARRRHGDILRFVRARKPMSGRYFLPGGGLIIP